MTSPFSTRAFATSFATVLAVICTNSSSSFLRSPASSIFFSLRSSLLCSLFSFRLFLLSSFSSACLACWRSSGLSDLSLATVSLLEGVVPSISHGLLVPKNDAFLSVPLSSTGHLYQRNGDTFLGMPRSPLPLCSWKG